VPIVIEGSKHQPPPAEEVPRHIDDLCEYVNDHWNDGSAFHLAAYVMWRLNWIHPFVDGNGRTTRAVSYYVLCAKLGFHMPGVTTVPEMIAQNKDPYYRALEAADGWQQKGVLNVSDMESLLSDLLARQMVLALQLGEGGTHDLFNRGRNGLPQTQKSGARISGEALKSSLTLKVGAVCAAVALLFFMILVLLSIWGHSVPRDARYLVIIVLALSAAVSAAFIGGNASARGVIPVSTLNEHPLAVAFTGGIAVLIALLLLGSYLFL
jgi:hypothetical protein